MCSVSYSLRRHALSLIARARMPLNREDTDKCTLTIIYSILIQVLLNYV